MQRTYIVRGFAAACLFSGIALYSTNETAATRSTNEPVQSFARGPDAILASRADRCGVEDPSADELALIEQAASNGNKDHGGVITIPVYWHIITTSNGTPYVGSLVPAQMQVLNDTYAGSKFAFELKSIDEASNDAWFFAAQGSADERAMKKALRKGGPESLNIYTTNGDVFLGWATLPFHYRWTLSFDGIVIWWAAMPGTGLAYAHPGEPDGVLTYDQGDTVTHEVGHWLGLQHTFAPNSGAVGNQGACVHPGDVVKDTPIEAAPSNFCVAHDSCVGTPFPGDDSITNFMNYTDDVCMQEFTAEQTKRMRKQWHAFRDKKTRE